MGLVDTHCHLMNNRFKDDFDETMARCLDTLDWLVVIGIEPETNLEALAMTGDRVYAAVGFHPYNANQVNDETLATLRDQAAHDKVRAIGEMGLDYFNEYCPRDLQAIGFRRQMELAVELQLPIIIHNREADQDCYDMLKEFAPDLKGCVMHCFSSGPDFAEQCVDLGFHVSFAGNATYPKAQNIRDAAAVVPMDRMFVETDAPYLAPQPRRGKRCEPADVVHTAAVLAEVKGLSPDDFAAQTTANAARFFGVAGN